MPSCMGPGKSQAYHNVLTLSVHIEDMCGKALHHMMEHHPDVEMIVLGLQVYQRSIDEEHQ